MIAAAISTIVAALRLYIKAVIVKKCTFTDAIFFSSYAVFVCDLALCTSNVYHGVYQHAWNITHEQLNKIQGVGEFAKIGYID